MCEVRPPTRSARSPSLAQPLDFWRLWGLYDPPGQTSESPLWDPKYLRSSLPRAAEENCVNQVLHAGLRVVLGGVWYCWLDLPNPCVIKLRNRVLRDLSYESLSETKMHKRRLHRVGDPVWGLQ